MVRFGPFSPEGCKRNAVDTYEDDLDCGRQPRFGVSVFATRVQEGADLDAAIEHLCMTAPVGGKKIATMWLEDIERLGFSVHCDEPPPMHYLVGEGDLSALPDTDKLSLAWANNRIDNPAYRKG